MAIHQATYKPWSGTRVGRVRVIWGIIWNNALQSFRNRWVIGLLILCFLFVGAISFTFFLETLLPGAVRLNRFLPEFTSNNAYRTFLTNNLTFLVIVLIAAAAGSGLLSRDLRTEAIPLYLSRPITKLDYLAGKAGALGMFLLSATLLPTLVIWAAAAAVGTEEIGWGSRILDLAGILLTSLIVMLPMIAVVLAFSSLSRKPAIAGIYWVLFYITTDATGAILAEQLESTSWSLLVWSRNLDVISRQFFEVRVPMNDAAKLVATSDAAAAMVSITVAALILLWARLRRFEEA